MMTSYLLGITFSVVVFVVIFLHLRNAGMKERYAAWWILIGIVVLIVTEVGKFIRFRWMGKDGVID